MVHSDCNVYPHMRRRENSFASFASNASIGTIPESFSPTSPRYYDPSETVSSSLRQQNLYSSAVDEFWPSLRLHPAIDAVLTKLLDELKGGRFTYTIAWQIMNIVDLNIVYRLSVSTSPSSPGEPSVGKALPQNALLETGTVLDCVKYFCQQHVDHHIAPDCFMERGIQIRALVSCLSLLALMDPPDERRPARLTVELRKTIEDGITTFVADLNKSGGSAADKGDCEFMARYALNLLRGFPDDKRPAAKLADILMGVLFAAGMAYQYNGPGVIRQLQSAVSNIQPKLDNWHAEFDQLHHLTIIVLSWSLYHPSAPVEEKVLFMELCAELIASLRQKLRDRIHQLNEMGPSRSTKSAFLGKMVALFPSIDAKDTRVHITYGMMYLLGRLVERFMVEGGTSVIDHYEIAETRRYLISQCSKTGSKYAEIRFKAYEIIFTTLSYNPYFTDPLAVEKIRHYLTTTERTLDAKELEAHLQCIVERRGLIYNAVSRLNLDTIKDLHQEYKRRNTAENSHPATPHVGPIASPTIPSSAGFVTIPMSRDASRESHGSASGYRRHSLHPHDYPNGLYQARPVPGSPHSSSRTDFGSIEVDSWIENPVPYPPQNPVAVKSESVKIKGNYVCVRFSSTGNTLAVLSQHHIDVYNVSIQPDEKREKSIKLKAVTCFYDKTAAFIDMSLTDTFLAVITRDTMLIHGFGGRRGVFTNRVPRGGNQLRYNSVAVCPSSDGEPAQVALGLLTYDKIALIQIFTLTPTSESSGIRPKLSQTLEIHPELSKNGWEPSTIHFSSGSHLLATCSHIGTILSWSLSHPSPALPSYSTTIPTNDNRGYGVAGVTSAVLFPSARYVLATTGSSTEPAVIKARSGSGKKPAMVTLAGIGCAAHKTAVSKDENAVVVISEGGRCWLYRLEAGERGFRVGEGGMLGEIRGGLGGDVVWGPGGIRTAWGRSTMTVKGPRKQVVVGGWV